MSPSGRFVYGSNRGHDSFAIFSIDGASVRAPVGWEPTRGKTPRFFLTRRNGLVGLGMTLADLGALGFRIVADPSTPLLAAFAAWQKIYAKLANGFGIKSKAADWEPAEKAMLSAIDLDKLLAVERATVEKGKQ